MSILGKEFGYKEKQMSILVKDELKLYEEFANKKTGEIHRIYESSSDWNKSEFADNTDSLIQFASELGVRIMTPEEYYASEEYKNKT